MKRTSLRLWPGLALLLLIPNFLSAQQASAPTAPHTAVITFIGDINVVSVGQLLAIVNTQVRSGVHNIRIVISSGGGDPSAAFAAYNYLRNLPDVEITTFNIGNVDSAAVVLYCAGRYRYSFPATRFLVHGSSLTVSGNAMMDAAALQGNLQVLNSLNQMIVHVISSTVNKKERGEIENAVRSQEILTPEEAIKWGLAQEIRSNFMEPGAVLVSVGVPPATETKPPIQFTSTTPAGASRRQIRH